MGLLYLFTFTVQGHIVAEVLPSTRRCLYSIPDLHQPKSTLQSSNVPSYKTTLSHPFLKGDTVEAVIQVAEPRFWEGPSPELGRSTHPGGPSVTLGYCTLKIFIFLRACLSFW